MLNSQKKLPLCITNAGMYTPQRLPEGLLIVDSVEIEGVDLEKKKNLNFYMEPNGVFYLDSSGAHIVTTKSYVSSKKDPFLATQSGPMLVIKDKHHPAFNYDSKSTKLRSGVGIMGNGKVVFLISDKREVNFHEFATVFKDLFGCENALFLDGAISKMYLKELRPNDLGGGFGPIISISKKN